MSSERNVGGALVGDFGKLRCRNPEGQRALKRSSSVSLRARPRTERHQGRRARRAGASTPPRCPAATSSCSSRRLPKPRPTRSPACSRTRSRTSPRHVTEALIRELGIGALIRLFAGNVGANAEQIVALSYTRANEAQVDADTIPMLKRGEHLGPSHRRLVPAPVQGGAGVQRRVPSKPSAERQARAELRPQLRSAGTLRSCLSRDQSAALFDICRKAAGALILHQRKAELDKPSRLRVKLACHQGKGA